LDGRVTNWLDTCGPCAVWETGRRMVGDGYCCKLFIFRDDRRSAIGMWGYTPVRITGVLVVKDVLSW